MNTEYNKNEILNKLKLASEKYYNNEELILTDEEYDSLYNYAVEKGWIKQDEKLNDFSIKTKNEVEHLYPMLSLQKANNLEELEKYYNRIIKTGEKTNFIIEPKLDGIALSIQYDKNGDICLLSTRGNGIFGENVTYLLNEYKLNILGIPTNVDKKIREIRGELCCSKQDLLYNNKERETPFSNERNAVAGIVKKSKLGLDENTKLTFVSYFYFDDEYNLIDYNNQRLIKSVDLLNDNIAFNFDDLKEKILLFQYRIKELDMITDGVVIKPTNKKIKLGNTEHHPKEYIAYKYPTETKLTKIKDVEFTVGKTGKITPVAILESINIAGVDITRATLHNCEMLKKLGVTKGCSVLVKRANEVIPYIVSVVEKTDKPIDIPYYCPYCFRPLKGNLKNLHCANELCSCKNKSYIKTIIGKKFLDIEGMSSEVVDSSNIKDIVDLFSLSLKDLVDLKFNSGVSLGEKRALEIYNNIQLAKKNTKNYIWLSCIGFNNIGNRTSKILLEYYKTINNLLTNAKECDIINIKGIGIETFNEIDRNRYKVLENYNKLKELGCIMETNVNRYEKKIKICHTGKVCNEFENRDSMIKYLEELYPVEFVSTVTKDLDYLLTEEMSNSGKTKKAIQLNKKIVNYNELIDILQKEHN